MSAANWQQLDPHFDAESEKYHQAIPSRDFILSFLEQSKKSYSINAFSKTWQLDDAQAQALSARLNAMEREGQVVRNKRHAFTIAPATPEIIGKVHGQAEGHGFLVPDDNSDWIYITPADMKTVFHGDRVSISLLPSNKERRQGKIRKILERGTERLVGRFAKQGAVSVVVPENKRLSHQITLSNADDFSLNFGELVLVQITTQPAKQKLPVGKILQKLGMMKTPA
jgi:ribonuclease R